MPVIRNLRLNEPSDRSAASSLLVSGLTACLILAGLVCTALAPTPAQAQSSDEEGPWLNLRPYFLDLWSPRAGIGAGAGLVLNNAFQKNDEALLTVAPAWHERVYTLSYASGGHAVQEDDRNVLLLGGRHAYTTRNWFYGFGPASSPDARIAFEHRTFQGHARFGRYYLGETLFVQAHARIEHHRVYDADRPEISPTDAAAQRANDYAGALAMLDTDVRPIGAAFTTSGAVTGLDVRYDRRDQRYRTRRGVLLQTSAERWTPVGGQEVSFLRTDIDAYGWLPLGGAHRIAVSARLTQLHDVDGASALNGRLPHVLTPTLDGRHVPGFPRDRYTGRDVLAARLAYEFPVASILGFDIEGYAGAHAASVYDDIGEQFSFAIDGSKRLAPDRDTYPLRPAVSAGLHVGPRFRDQTYVDVAVGRGPDGFSAVRVSLVRRLDRPRPPHHDANRWRR